MGSDWRATSAFQGGRMPEAPVHALRFGGGPRTIVGLHGWSGSHRTYVPLSAHLPPEASLWAPDLPGCGASPAPAPLTREAVVGSLCRWLASLPGAGEVTLVGTCSGALVALLLAPEPGPPVERLVLIDPFAYVPAYLRLFLLGALGRGAYWTAFANPLGRWLTDGALARHRSRGADLTAGFATVDHRVMLAYLHLLADLGSIGRFADVAQPIDIAYGERTFGAVRRSIGQWRALFPQARCIEVAGVGHLPLEEAPERLAEIVFTPAAPAL